MKESRQCREFRLAPGVLSELVDGLSRSYADGYGVNPAGGANLPRRREILSVLAKLEALLFPGFDEETTCRMETISYVTGDILQQLYRELCDLCSRSFCYLCETRKPGAEPCRIAERGEEAVTALLRALPELREIAKSDIDAAYAGDPAARNKAEIIISYPALKAIEVQRAAHILYHHEVPFLPRMMTEHAHSLTGIDIHPGSQLGRGFFIDHGTGVVIGETAVIGDNVRLYQGVTLGALSFPKDACGMLVKGLRRHPTIGDNVTIYANATVLGDITIGSDSVLGGNVWITESLPPGTKVAVAPGDHKIKYREKKA